MTLRYPNVLLATAVLFGGCATPGLPPVRVEVSSFARPVNQSDKAYWIFPGNEGAKANDIDFIEFSGVVDRALVQHGFRRAASAPSADVAIVLTYGIGEPRERTVTFVRPVFGPMDTVAAHTSGTVHTSGATATYHTPTTIVPTDGVTDYQTTNRTVTTFTLHAVVSAHEMARPPATKDDIVLWETRMSSSGQGGYLARLFPVLIAAGAPQFGQNSGCPATVALRESDARAIALASHAQPGK